MPINSQLHLEGLPDWARLLSEKYYSGTVAMFVLYGNVRDVVPKKENGKTEFLPLRRFLNTVLFGQRNIVLNYDRGGGIEFDHRRGVNAAIGAGAVNGVLEAEVNLLAELGERLPLQTGRPD